MTSPESSGGKNGRSVGVALIAIVVGTSFVFSYAASDGKLLSQFFNSDKEEPDSAVAETPESAAPPESMRESDDQGTESSGNSQTLSDEERQRLMQAKNFPWSLASDEYLESLATQDAFDGFKKKEPSLQSGQSAGLTTGLSILSDKAAAEIDIFVFDDLGEREDDDSEQLDLMFEDDAPDDRAESEPTAGDTEEPEQPSPPAEQDIDEPDNSTVPDIENDTDDQPVEDEPADTAGNDTGTSDDSGSNSTGTSETSNSTSDE